MVDTSPDVFNYYCSQYERLANRLPLHLLPNADSNQGDLYLLASCRDMAEYCSYCIGAYCSYSSSSSSSSSSCSYAASFNAMCSASWVRSALNSSASGGAWRDMAQMPGMGSYCVNGRFIGASGTWIDDNGVKHTESQGLCNGCPKGYLKGEDGRCHQTPQDCRVAAIDGNTTFCSSNGGCVYGYDKYDGFGGCASAGASLSSYSQNPSNTHCDVNIDYNYSYSAPFYGKGAAYGTYIDENGETKEDLLCADSGCPKGYAKTEDGRCKTLENTEGCGAVWAKGDRVYCGYCQSGYGKTPFGDCKPCSPGCKNGCKSDDYTTCNSGGWCKAGYSGAGCDTCTGGKFYQDGECVSSCAEGYYQAGTKCVKNPDGCASYNYSTGSCSDCSGGSYLDGADCKANPEGCDSYNGTSCDVCSGGYYSDSGICKANPTGCTDYSGTYCYSCSSGYLEKDGACIPASNGCGAGYKDMGGFCNRVQWTPAEAAAVLTDDNNNSVTITFKK